MKERPDKRKNTLRSLRDLAGVLREAPEEALPPGEPVRAHPLSSAATDESPPGGDLVVASDAPDAPAAVDVPDPEAAKLAERPEWADIVKRKESGILNGKRFWIAPDGGAYLDSGGSIPTRFGHGGKHVFTGKKSGVSETLYWNAEKSAFTPDDPMPELRRKPSKKEKQTETSDYDESGLRHSRIDLRARVAKRDMSDEARTKFDQGIRTMKTRADRRALMELLKDFPAKDAVPSNTGEEIKEKLEPVSPPTGLRDTYREDAFDTEGHNLDELMERLRRRKGRKYDPLLDGPKKGLSIGGSHEPNQSDVDRGESGESDTETREQLIARLDPKGFAIMELHADNYKGGPGQGTENLYFHPDAPGNGFTETEVNRRRNAPPPPPEKPPVPPTPDDEGGDGGGNDGGDNPPGGGDDVASADRVVGVENEEDKPDWSTKGKEFLGIKPKPIREILADPTDELYFGILIGSYKGASLIKEKSLSGEPLSSGEKEILEYARYEYARRMARIETIREFIKTSDLEIVARRDPAFAQVLGFNGPERTAEIFKRQIPHVCMKRVEVLDRLYNTCVNLKELRDAPKYKKWERDVQVLAREAGVGVEDFDRMYNTTDAETRRASQDALAEKFRSSYSPFKRIVDRVYPFSQRKAGKLMRKAVKVNDKLVRSYASPQSRAVSRVEEELSSLTEMLNYTVTRNPEISLMLEHEAFQNKNLQPGSESGPHTYTEAKAESERAPQSADEVINEHVHGFKSKDGYDWDHTPIVERQESMRGLSNDLKRKENASGQGWFARALAAIFRSFFGTKSQEAINRPVLAS